jgi:hypothetical protein
VIGGGRCHVGFPFSTLCIDKRAISMPWVRRY